MRTVLSFYCATLMTLVFLPATERLHAQVRVQLPTFHRFGVTTTVVVPDRGGVYLGGVSGGRRTSSSVGLPLGRHLPGVAQNLRGNSSYASGLSVHATIIDHQELDRAVLAEAARRRAARLQTLHTPSAEAGRAATYLRRARQAEAAGQREAAKVFYQRVARHGNPQQRRQAQDRLALMENPGN